MLADGRIVGKPDPYITPSLRQARQKHNRKQMTCDTVKSKIQCIGTDGSEQTVSVQIRLRAVKVAM